MCIRDRAKAAAQAAARTPKNAKKKPAQKARNPYRFKKLEEAIIKLEEEREKVMAALADEKVYRDPGKMRDAQYRLAEIERDLEEKNAEWEAWA